MQTLTDKEYQRLRDASVAIIREMGVECGGSNVQMAVNPADGEVRFDILVHSICVNILCSFTRVRLEMTCQRATGKAVLHRTFAVYAYPCACPA